MSNNSPITWKKSYTTSTHDINQSSSIPMSVSISSSISRSNTSSPIGIQKRRKSSFNSLYSPYTRRRSFLSKNMIENESVQCYKISSYSSQTIYNNNSNNNNYHTIENIPSFSISLSESQGFLWNQDLFASSYQQSEAGVHNMMSMSDGSYYLNNNDNEYQISSNNTNINSENHNSNSNVFVNVIDVILDKEDYKSDVDIVTEVVKVENYDDDDDDEEEDNEDEDEIPAAENSLINENITMETPYSSKKDIDFTKRITRSMDRRIHNNQHLCKNNTNDADAEEEEEADDDENIFISDL